MTAAATNSPNPDDMIFFPAEMTNKLRAPFQDSETYRERDYTAIKWHAVARRLDETFGKLWSFAVISVQQLGNTWVATSRIRVRVPLLGGSDWVEVEREGVGAWDFQGNPSDDIKSCVSDSLKRAATLFGVGVYLYQNKVKPQAEQAAAPAPNLAQSFQVAAVRQLFHGYNMPDLWVFENLRFPSWDRMPAELAAAIMSGQHPVAIWLRQTYPNVAPPKATGGLAATNA